MIVYKTFKNLVSPPSRVKSTIERFMSARAGERILDLGCGYGDIAPLYADDCTYVGIDSNPSYIAEANKRYLRDNVSFVLGDITQDQNLDLGKFDLILMSGVLHHLPSADVMKLAKAITPLLTRDGRFVALEPVFHPEQGLIARLLIASDRGRHARDVEGYLSLLRQSFTNVDAEVVHNLLRIPYSHVVLTSRNN